MSIHLQKDIEKLKNKILALSAIVEKAVIEAFASIESCDANLAQKVIKGDKEIDQLEIDVEEECLKLLALHQPVATDLRFIIAVLKINNDLERIGDLAVNIAERTLFLSKQDTEYTIPSHLREMAETAESMLRRSLDALINMDADLARNIFKSDDIVDSLLHKMYVYMENTEGQGNLKSMMRIIFAARHIERIADLATNIAEDVIYTIEGGIVRHGGS